MRSCKCYGQKGGRSRAVIYEYEKNMRQNLTQIDTSKPIESLGYGKKLRILYHVPRILNWHGEDKRSRIHLNEFQ